MSLVGLGQTLAALFSDAPPTNSGQAVQKLPTHPQKWSGGAKLTAPPNNPPIERGQNTLNFCDAEGVGRGPASESHRPPISHSLVKSQRRGQVLHKSTPDGVQPPW